ncbi:WRKY transcription factor 22-like [Chenopodium quinoa]|uniref:WRKY transcription factor 22-like n=1 Tax=Chenopodium quinoa TaxID=63459 RepID=UPI000B76BCF9|nr:WRKY transcription factor 22-like [Chenopodium quinoa]
MMNELSFDKANEWSLQAIVKGDDSVTTTSSNTMNMSPCYDAWFESLLLGLDDNQGGQEKTMLVFNDELEPLNHSISSKSPNNIVDSSMLMNFDGYTSSPTDEPNEKATDVSYANAPATILKRRRIKHKIIKVVQQAIGDRVESDKWNWRKYGEKVIKGSPYPRSYYRCSYAGGCLARKQVEQSISDPGLFLITYMEEHSHPYPTRRHSQAGRCARRFIHSSPTKVVTENESQNALVRTITLESSTKNDRDLGVQGYEDDGSSTNYVGGERVCMGNRVHEDDFFAGLDYLEELKNGIL